jgi:hypothetical protein
MQGASGAQSKTPGGSWPLGLWAKSISGDSPPGQDARSASILSNDGLNRAMSHKAAVRPSTMYIFRTWGRVALQNDPARFCRPPGGSSPVEACRRESLREDSSPGTSILSTCEGPGVLGWSRGLRKRRGPQPGSERRTVWHVSARASGRRQAQGKVITCRVRERNLLRHRPI